MFGGLVIGSSSGNSSFSCALSTPANESLVFWALLALEGLSRLAFLGQCSLVVFAFAFLHSMAVGAALSRVAPFVLSYALGCGAPCHSPGKGVIRGRGGSLAGRHLLAHLCSVGSGAPSSSRGLV